MTTLQCLPRGICSWDYTISGDSCPSALLEFATFGEQATIHCPDPYEVKKVRTFGSEWNLLQTGRTLASAGKPDAFSRRMTLSSDRVNLEIVPTRILSNDFEIRMDSRVVGSIVKAHAFTRRSTLECDPVIPVELQIFAFTLVVIAWRRASD